MLVSGLDMLLSMCLAAWGPTIGGTTASFGIYAFAFSFGPTVIIDGIRTSMWYQEVFGSGYAVKIAVDNSMNIIVRTVTGVIQDRDNNSYVRQCCHCLRHPRCWLRRCGGRALRLRLLERRCETPTVDDEAEVDEG
jgi:hypothetical protein